MQPNDRLHALDAVRAFALLAGVALHASMAYLPGLPNFALTPAPEHAKSAALGVMLFAIHLFRMTTFFVIAGFFARQMLLSKGVKGFIRNRLMRILVPLVAGWPLVIASFAGLWIWGLHIASHGGPLPKPPAAAHSVPLAFPLTHLWFLYVLLELYVAMLLLRGLVVMVDRKGRLRAAMAGLFALTVRSGLAPVLFAAPTAVLLASMPGWTPAMGIPTPDSNLIATPGAAVAYFLAFAGGWMLQKRVELLQALASAWSINLAMAVALGALAWAAGVPQGVALLGFPGHGPVLALVYIAAGWSSAFALIGLATRFLSRPSPAIRYLADASYWIYLAHLPLIYALNITLVGQPWPAEAKFAVVVGVATVLLLASYQLLVRYSFIGAVLNGRRQRPARTARLAVSPTPAGA